MKTKVFKFEVSNSSTNLSQYSAHSHADQTLKTEEEIEKTVNDFIHGLDDVHIEVTPVTLRQDQGGFCNTVWLYYTITYPEPISEAD